MGINKTTLDTLQLYTHDEDGTAVFKSGAFSASQVDVTLTLSGPYELQYTGTPRFTIIVPEGNSTTEAKKSGVATPTVSNTASPPFADGSRFYLQKGTIISAITESGGTDGTFWIIPGKIA